MIRELDKLDKKLPDNLKYKEVRPSKHEANKPLSPYYFSLSLTSLKESDEDGAVEVLPPPVQAGPPLPAAVRPHLSLPLRHGGGVQGRGEAPAQAPPRPGPPRPLPGREVQQPPAPHPPHAGPHLGGAGRHDGLEEKNGSGQARTKSEG